MTAALSSSEQGYAIEATGLDCGYGRELVLQNVSFNVSRGEIFFIIGGSGCGKSTLLKNLIGLTPPLAGEVKFFGKVFDPENITARDELLKTVGVVYQSSALWSSLSLRQNVSLPLEIHTSLAKREIEELATLKLAQVGLTGFEDYFPAEISGGMKKRAGLARALALDPEILFLDEPSAGLDPITSRKLDDLVLEIRESLGTSIVIVSHELASIFSIGDRAIMLERAEKGIIAEGNPRELAKPGNDPRVLEFLRRGDLPPA